MAVAETGLGAHLRGLRGELRDASDRTLIKVVAMLDRLDNRGQAEALMATLRPRLAHLRAPRRLTPLRIMFMPFDPLIVAATDWTRGSLALPRSILRPPCNIVHARTPDRMAAFDAKIAGDFEKSDGQALRIGRELWPLAGEILQAATMPADWPSVSGLRPTDFPPLCRRVAAVLRHTLAILELVAADAAGVAPTPSDISHFMAPFADEDVSAMATLIAILNLRLPHFSGTRALNQRLNADLGATPAREAADQAFDYILCTLEAVPAISDNLDQAVVEVTRMAAIIEAHAARAVNHVAEAGRITQARVRLDTACRTRFAEALTDKVLAPLGSGADADDTAVERIENAARALRRFDQAARRLGGAASYDRALQASTAQLRPLRHDSAAARIDKLRLAEILLDSTVAAQLT